MQRKLFPLRNACRTCLDDDNCKCPRFPELRRWDFWLVHRIQKLRINWLSSSDQVHINCYEHTPFNRNICYTSMCMLRFCSMLWRQRAELCALLCYCTIPISRSLRLKRFVRKFSELTPCVFGFVCECVYVCLLCACGWTVQVQHNDMRVVVILCVGLPAHGILKYIWFV